MFLGRNKEVSKIVRALRSKSAKIISVSGTRRIGKTHLIFEAINGSCLGNGFSIAGKQAVSDQLNMFPKTIDECSLETFDSLFLKAKNTNSINQWIDMVGGVKFSNIMIFLISISWPSEFDFDKIRNCIESVEKKTGNTIKILIELQERIDVDKSIHLKPLSANDVEQAVLARMSGVVKEGSLENIARTIHVRAAGDPSETRKLLDFYNQVVDSEQSPHEKKPNGENGNSLIAESQREFPLIIKDGKLHRARNNEPDFFARKDGIQQYRNGIESVAINVYESIKDSNVDPRFKELFRVFRDELKRAPSHFNIVLADCYAEAISYSFRKNKDEFHDADFGLIQQLIQKHQGYRRYFNYQSKEIERPGLIINDGELAEANALLREISNQHNLLDQKVSDDLTGLQNSGATISKDRRATILMLVKKYMISIKAVSEKILSSQEKFKPLIDLVTALIKLLGKIL